MVASTFSVILAAGSAIVATVGDASADSAGLGCAIWEACFMGRCCGAGTCSKANSDEPRLGCALWESCHNGRCCSPAPCSGKEVGNVTVGAASLVQEVAGCTSAG